MTTDTSTASLLQSKMVGKTAIDLLIYFSTKRHSQGLQTEGIYHALYNDLFTRGLLEFTTGKGGGLYLQTSSNGKLVLDSVLKQSTASFTSLLNQSNRTLAETGSISR